MNNRELVRDNFLARYESGTLALYSFDIDLWYYWCDENGFDPMEAKRAHVEAFARYLSEDRNNSPRSVSRRLNTLKSFYRLAVDDELVLRDPTRMLKMPRWKIDRSTIQCLSPHEVSQLLRAARETSPEHHALLALMAMLGLRVSEACNVDIEDFAEDSLGYVVLSARRKGGTVTRHPVPVPLLRIVEAARCGRESGPLILTKKGERQNRRGAYDWFKRVLFKTNLPSDCHPHTLRHAAITALVDAGVPMHEAQWFANHSDIRTTAHYYHRPESMDKHGAHVTARLFAS